jgi:hypothetical protein
MIPQPKHELRQSIYGKRPMKATALAVESHC